MSIEIGEWLERHALGRHVAVFAENEVDFATLSLLTEADLQELGLPFGPRKKILALLQKPETGSPREPSTMVANAVVAGLDDDDSGLGGERRQLTVMFCDMVGFTEVANRVDPEVLKQIITVFEAECRACVARFHGYVFTMLGDGVVAFYGYPRAHEAEAQRAIRAGLDIIETFANLDVPEIGRMQVRIGIAAGMVVVAPGERNAYGEAMNLAARLQACAEPGQIVVSQRVRRIAGGEFLYQDLGNVTLKGIPGDVHIHAVIGISGAESRFAAANSAGISPLVGRETEQNVLLSCWDDIGRTGVGHAVVMTGDAGIGKSRIVAALAATLEQQDSRLLYFQCRPFYTNTAFYPIITAFERLLHFVRDDRPGQRLERVVRLVESCGLERHDARFLALLLSVPIDDDHPAIELSAKLLKAETVRVLVAMVTAISRVARTAFVFEDVHWADPTSIDVITAVIERIAKLPTLLLLTSRRDFRPPWSDERVVTNVTLSRLGSNQCKALVTSSAGGRALPPDVTDRIVAKSDGVPLYIEELTRAVIESGDIALSAEGHYVLSNEAREVNIPDTLRDSLTARLDKLGSVKTVAQVGATLGREFSYEIIAALAIMAPPALDEALSRMVDAGLVFVRGQPPDAIYTFKHALVQDIAYDLMLKSERRILHARIASVLETQWPTLASTEPELLAHHHSGAGNTPRAVTLWFAAGALAMKRFAVIEASAHLRHGLVLCEVLPPSPERERLELDFRILLGPALVAEHGWGNPDVGRVLEPAWALVRSLGDRAAHVPVLNALWVHYMTIDRLAASLDWADKLVLAGRADDDDTMLVTGLRAAAASQFWQGDFVAACRNGDDLAARYDTGKHWHVAQMTNTDPLTGERIYRSQYLWILGYPDQAAAVARANDAHARLRNHPFDLAFALTLGAQVWELRCEPEELLTRIDEAEHIARERGVPILSETLAEISRGIAWLHLGRTADGVAKIATGTARLWATGHRVWLPYLHARQAHGMALEGNGTAALALVEAAVHAIVAGEQRAHYAEVLRLKGEILLLANRVDEAEDVLRVALAIAHRQQARSWELRAATTLACVLRDRGQPDAARDILLPVREWFSEGFRTHDLRQADTVLATLAPTAVIAA